MNEKITLWERHLPSPVECLVIMELRWNENDIRHIELYYAQLDSSGKLKKIEKEQPIYYSKNVTGGSIFQEEDSFEIEKRCENYLDGLTDGCKRKVNFLFVEPEKEKAREYSYLFSEERFPWHSYDISELPKIYNFYNDFIMRIFQSTKCEYLKKEIERQNFISSLFKIESQ